VHARLDRGAVKLLTHRFDWTPKCPPIAEAVASIGARQAYLDGELCGIFPNGITSYNMIQAASGAGNGAGLVYFIFDLLHRDRRWPCSKPPKIARGPSLSLGSAVTKSGTRALDSATNSSRPAAVLWSQVMIQPAAPHHCYGDPRRMRDRC
jgi:hypothetical protein